MLILDRSYHDFILFLGSYVSEVYLKKRPSIRVLTKGALKKYKKFSVRAHMPKYDFRSYL